MANLRYVIFFAHLPTSRENGSFRYKIATEKNERNAGNDHTELRWARLHKPIIIIVIILSGVVKLGDKHRSDKLLEKLEQYCAPKGNVVNAYALPVEERPVERTIRCLLERAT